MRPLLIMATLAAVMGIFMLIIGQFPPMYFWLGASLFFSGLQMHAVEVRRDL